MTHTMTHNLFFLGDEFYYESKTMMSSIYSEDWTRWDWGKVSVALGNGDTVHIRPANAMEIRMAFKHLEKLNAEYS